MENENIYNPISRDELQSVVGGTEEAFLEALAGLISKGIIDEHHDGGFVFNPLVVDTLLYESDPENQVWLG